jgi:hypothetical protein
MADQVRREVIERISGGVRPCRGCDVEIRKVGGCVWIECPHCHRGQCWFCGKVIPHTSAACQNHNCDPNGLIEWVIAKLSGPCQRSVTRPPEEVICMITWTDARITVPLKPDMTVLQLKEAIKQKTGYEIFQQGRLEFGTKILQDHFRICQYNIRHLSTVELTLEAKGGI